MAAVTSFFRRPEGAGWLILSGGHVGDEQVARVLGVMGVAGPALALVPFPNDADQGKSQLLAFTDPSGLSGTVGVLEPRDGGGLPPLEALDEAALIVLVDCGPAEFLREALEDSGASDRLLGALRGGCVVVAQGVAAEVLGQFMGSEKLSPGLGWLPGAVIQSHYLPGRPCPALSGRSHLYRLGLMEESVMALGPEGTVELWGGPSPVVTFGTSWLK